MTEDEIDAVEEILKRLPEGMPYGVLRLIAAAREANRQRANALTVFPEDDCPDPVFALVALHASLQSENERLRAELARWRPLTPEEAQKAYDEAEAVPLSEESIDGIMQAALDPATSLPNDDKAKLVGHVRRLQTRVEALEAALRPFTRIARRKEWLSWADDIALIAYGYGLGANLGDCRNAAALLNQGGQK